jgi:hypothetical protein
MAVTVTNASYALKTLYSRERVEKLLYTDNPLLAMISKNEGLHREKQGHRPHLRAARWPQLDVRTAQANKGQTSGGGFTITRASDYSLVSITVRPSKRPSPTLARW